MAVPTRRAVLRAGVCVAVAGAVPMALAGPASALSAGLPSGLHRRVFLPLVGSPFLFTDGAHSYRAVLTAVRSPGRQAGNDRYFSMLFASTATIREGQYRVRHGRLRPFHLYIGPVGAKPGWYEAIVNS
ncbi:MAG: hypothetical protein QOE45_2531 [Frankiaceae bacterium]|jgi:hypothetical protein|nr:hypothetical protein [Frankiaceae bacterium]